MIVKTSVVTQNSVQLFLKNIKCGVGTLALSPDDENVDVCCMYTPPHIINIHFKLPSYNEADIYFNFSVLKIYFTNLRKTISVFLAINGIELVIYGYE